ncbi:hypothetical protein V7794_23000 [Rhizobium laguerreae]
MENHLKADDATPHLSNCYCGAEPVPEYGPTSIVACPNCSEFVAVTTPRFFADPWQREHEIWRAVSAWRALQRATDPGKEAQ